MRDRRAEKKGRGRDRAEVLSLTIDPHELRRVERAAALEREQAVVGDRDPGSPLALRKMKWRPSGRNDGKRCAISPAARVVAGRAAPPSALTARMPPPDDGANRILFEIPQLPPRGCGASLTTWIVPWSTSM